MNFSLVLLKLPYNTAVLLKPFITALLPMGVGRWISEYSKLEGDAGLNNVLGVIMDKMCPMDTKCPSPL